MANDFETPGLTYDGLSPRRLLSMHPWMEWGDGMPLEQEEIDRLSGEADTEDDEEP